ncbi:Imm74 family immunity protein [Microbulbifer marinus]|uniref:Immunity protein 74 n=1 Tax=Microbulbifer marinus TaxID=658218 RepID=A0A1H3VNW8_9GAMM|nr:Imm74 family immunity protein [Microbulbifer marinus]SDZ76381.1 Immunity protein 74 [Microbulbifer marinus]
MIKEIARGHIVLQTEHGTVTILGEALLPGYGSPDFIAYENSINEWDEPKGELIGCDLKKKILRQLLSDAKERNIKIEIE